MVVNMTKSRTKQKCVNSAKFYIGSDKRSNRACDFTPYLKNAFQTRITDITRIVTYTIDHKSAPTIETKQYPRLPSITRLLTVESVNHYYNQKWVKFKHLKPKYGIIPQSTVDNYSKTNRKGI